jgi:hypothetical protein
VAKLSLWTVWISLFVQAPAFASRAYSCVKHQDGAHIRIEDQVIGFSSVDRCEEQMEQLVNGRSGGVVCGCRAEDESGQSLEAIFASFVGVSRTVMYLECYRLEGGSLQMIRQIPYSTIRETRVEAGKLRESFFGEKVKACRQQELLLRDELRSRS